MGRIKLLEKSKQKSPEFYEMLLFVLALVLLIGCGQLGNEGEDIVGEAYRGPGSDYRLILSDSGEFQVNEYDSGLEVKGVYESLASGFLELTVGSSNMAEPSYGDKAHVLNVPGFISILKPLDENGDQIISMVHSTGECPSSDINANWIITDKPNSSDSYSDEAYGAFSWNALTDAASLPARYAIDGTSMGSQSLGSFSCANGIGTVDDAKMYFTENGAIVTTNVNSSDDRNLIIAMNQESLSSFADIDGDYVGLVFSEPEVMPVAMSASGGLLDVDRIDDISANTTSDLGSMDLTYGLAGSGSVNDPEPGFMRGKVIDAGSSDEGRVSCMAKLNVENSGKNVIFCRGTAPDNTNSKGFNALFVSK